MLPYFENSNEHPWLLDDPDVLTIRGRTKLNPA